ncbi:hypothetical protein C8R47DRAFT_1260204 [Mycena vitilis]|nr:hypothetical protein C8R47DRAFT_1260204 [Mycena vitilis]
MLLIAYDEQYRRNVYLYAVRPRKMNRMALRITCWVGQSPCIHPPARLRAESRETCTMYNPRHPGPKSGLVCDASHSIPQLLRFQAELAQLSLTTPSPGIRGYCAQDGSVSSLRPYAARGGSTTPSMLGKQIAPWPTASPPPAPAAVPTDATFKRMHRRTMTPTLEPDPEPVLRLRPSRIRPVLSVTTSASASPSPPSDDQMQIDGRAPSSLTFASRSSSGSVEDAETLRRARGLPPVFTRGHARNRSSLLPDAPAPKSSQGSTLGMPIAREAKRVLGMGGTMGRSAASGFHSRSRSRPQSGISFTGFDSFEEMLGGGHVRRQSIGSMYDASPCVRVSRRKHVAFQEDDAPSQARVLERASLVFFVGGPTNSSRILTANASWPAASRDTTALTGVALDTTAAEGCVNRARSGQQLQETARRSAPRRKLKATITTTVAFGHTSTAIPPPPTLAAYARESCKIPVLPVANTNRRADTYRSDIDTVAHVVQHPDDNARNRHSSFLARPSPRKSLPVRDAQHAAYQLLRAAAPRGTAAYGVRAAAWNVPSGGLLAYRAAQPELPLRRCENCLAARDAFPVFEDLRTDLLKLDFFPNSFALDFIENGLTTSTSFEMCVPATMPDPIAPSCVTHPSHSTSTLERIKKIPVPLPADTLLALKPFRSPSSLTHRR